MEFVDRDAERAALREALQAKTPALVRVYGRRRLGKTELLRRVCDEADGIYLLVDDADTEQVLASLSRQLAAETDALATPFATWDDLFAKLPSATGERFVVLDEFQRLVENDPGAVTRLQDHWDRALRLSGPSLVLCGSSVGMMQRLTAGRRGPLFGRLTHDLRVRAFDYAAVRLLYPNLDEAEKARRFAVFGGTPFYHNFSVGRELDDAIRRAFLENTSPLRDEPQTLLQMELNAHTRYNSILYEIGQGTHALADLESKIGVKHGGLGPYLEVLRHDLDLIRMEQPVGGKQKNARYVLADAFFAFYYRFVFGDRARLELGRVDAVAADIRRDLDGHVGRRFEDVARQALVRANGTTLKGVALDFDEIGPWWNRRGEELDIVALGRDEVLAGEVRWSAAPQGPDLVREAVRKGALVERRDARAVRPVVVARGGLTPAGQAEAEAVHALVLDLADLTEVFDRVG